MRIAIASILQESNTFSPVATHYKDFNPVFGREAYLRHEGKLTEMGGFIDVLRRARATIVPVCAAWAITANRLVRSDFERLVDEFEIHLRRAKPEALLLAMHGAQTADAEDDVEGVILQRARTILGPGAPIVMTLDLHANITRRMIELSSAIVGYHTYPHVDMFEAGQKAGRIMLRIVKGEVRPQMAWRKLPLILQAENSQTSSGPMQKLIAAAQLLEQSGKAEAVSIFPVQPWMDIGEMGCAVVSVTNGDARAAQKQADTIGRSMWDNRIKFEAKLTPVPEAIEAALKITGGPVVLSESSDSTGSGSPGDSTGVLKHLLRAQLTGPAAIFLVDPAAVDSAIQSGIGSTVTMKIGGAFDKKHSKPVKVTGNSN